MIAEPAEGAHTDPNSAAELVKETIQKALGELDALSPQELIDDRYNKFRRMGSFFAEGGLNKTVVIGVAFVIVVLAFLVYSSMHIAKYRVEVCIGFHGANQCRTASADTQDHALRSAQSNACALLVSGVTDTMQCEHQNPVSVKWLDAK